MKYRVDLDFVGINSAADAYGGKLQAWSFKEIEGEVWFKQFRTEVINSIGKKYTPIYRMADGEYRFLMGRKFNPHRNPIWKEFLAVYAERLGLWDKRGWKTSWGESYPIDEHNKLKDTLLKDIKFITKYGYIGLYLNDNGLNAFTEYNKHIVPYLSKNNIFIRNENYIPFHFVVALLVNNGWEVFIEERNILVVSGTSDETEHKIVANLKSLGAKSVQFMRISKNSSLKSELDLKVINCRPDICFVAAGIGSAHVLKQLSPLNTVALDIGGFLNCLIDYEYHVHGGLFRLPKVK